MKVQLSPPPPPPPPVETPPTPFEAVYHDELKEIQERRRRQLYIRPNRAAGRDGVPPSNLVGLALSGGGIRSATFCLGLLQGMHKLGLLRIFDYLSTVSGGGYVGGWWSAWLSRDQINSRLCLTSQDEEDVELCGEDIKNPVALLIKLRGSGDDMSVALREQHLSPGMMQLLSTFKENDSSPEEIRKAQDALAAELNSAIRDKFFSKLKFRESPEAEGGQAEGDDAAARHSAWVNRLILEDAYPCEFKDIFPPREQIEPDRFPSGAGGATDAGTADEAAEAQPAGVDAAGAAATATGAPKPGRGGESAMNAWIDPIHHLRLFANYLTPRRGLLSYDTWRAVSVITRNLTLTWLILLPVLTAVMLLGQLYFLLDPATAGQFVKHDHALGDVVGARLWLIAQPVAAIAGLVGVLWIAWMLCIKDKSSLSDLVVQIVCLLAVPLIAGVTVYDLAGDAGSEMFRATLRDWRVLAWLAGAGALFAYAMFWPVRVSAPPGGGEDVERQWRRELRRHKISRIHTKLMIWMAVVAAVLLLAGFGHEFIDHVRKPDEPDASGLRLGGLLPLLGAIGGSIFTALKAAPSSDEKGQRREPSLVTKLIFAVTPSLVVAVLAVTVSWLAHVLLGHILPGESGVMRYPNIPKVCTVAGILLCFALAIYEMKPQDEIPPSWSLLLFVGLLAISLLWFGNTLVPYLLVRPSWWMTMGLVFGVAAALLVLQRLWKMKRRLAEGVWSQKQSVHRYLEYLAAGLAVVATLATFAFDRVFGSTPPAGKVALYNTLSSLVPMSLTALTGSIILFRLLVVRRENGQSYFALKAFRHTALGRRPEALVMVGLVCLLLPIAAACWFYAALMPQPDPAAPWRQQKLIALPLLLAALSGGVILLRVIALKEKARPDDGASRPLRGALGSRLRGGRVSARVAGLAGAHRRKVLVGTTGSSILMAVVTGLMLRYEMTRDDAAALPQLFTQSLGLTGGPVASFLLLNLSLMLFRVSDDTSERPAGAVALQRRWQRRVQDHSRGLARLLTAACILTALLVGYVADVVPAIFTATRAVADPGALDRMVIAGMVACFMLALFEIKWGKSDNRRSLWLLACTYATLTTLFLVNSVDLGNDPMLNTLRSVFGLIVAVLVWVVALGWTVDPNSVSMHHFYKGRLVRAYLGASNLMRREQHKEIAELAADDDPCLADLKNCQRGAPYHIVNATLNLVAGRDLATAQRSASSFVLSKKYCGSLRTKFRDTCHYMRGQLTLGTAIAASGAAVSPNMGSKKPTAALAMLLTLLNVRLGFWAPTPNMENWQMSQPRLWPFYLLREFLSQTNDLSSYCYLTDGGHFDNTGLYALVERGCRHIVLVDCGADPQPSCFQDLGDAIRRCRIDFGAEVKIDLSPLIAHGGDHAKQSFVVGGIRYSRKHARALGWDLLPEEDSKEDKDSRTGIIVYFKPAIVGCETADVRQYAIENKHFPQQATTNQWFDEAQFESYRRLGQLCAKRAFGKLKAVERLGHSTRLSPALIEEIFQEANQKFNAAANA